MILVERRRRREKGGGTGRLPAESECALALAAPGAAEDELGLSSYCPLRCVSDSPRPVPCSANAWRTPDPLTQFVSRSPPIERPLTCTTDRARMGAADSRDGREQDDDERGGLHALPHFPSTSGVRFIVPCARDASARNRGVGRITGGRETPRGTSRARATARGGPPDRARRARRAGSLPPDPEPPTAALLPPRPGAGR